MERLGTVLVKLSIMVCILMVAVMCAYADDTHELGVQKRIAKQQKRINDGVISGRLTAPEARVLQENLNQVKNKEKKLRADGKLNSNEKERLHMMLDKNSKMIMNKKQNPVRNVNP
jgi:hypothetical protein